MNSLEIHEVETSQAKFSCGYSLGELAALSFGKTFSVDDMIRLPLAMAADSVKLAGDITMGVLFSRGPLISEVDVERLCLQITSEGKGTLGISAILSPNTYLLIGQQNTVQRFKRIMHGLLPNPAHLRVNNNRWPPLHTPIVRQKNIADRASVMMETGDRTSIRNRRRPVEKQPGKRRTSHEGHKTTTQENSPGGSDPGYREG